MTLPAQLAKHLREVYFGGNWTSVNYRDTLMGVTWNQAAKKIGGFNSIATLVFHTHYYIAGVAKVLRGGSLDLKDSMSFDYPLFQSGEAWQAALAGVWRDAEDFANAVAALPDERLAEVFVDEKYGTYHRNILGIIEHLHYHLGQIILLKKMLAQET